MSAGDLLYRSYQYEFRNLLFGSDTDFVTTSVDGLLSMPAITDADLVRTNDHGAFPGIMLMGKRIVSFDMTIVGDPGVDIEEKLGLVRDAFKLPKKRDSTDLEPFVFWRPGEPRKLLYARCTRREFVSEYNTARGLAKGSVELQAPDPVIYSLDSYTQNVVLPISDLGEQFSVQNLGDHEDGYKPIITVGGPATNPRIQNIDDDLRTIRIDTVLSAAQTLVIDVANRTVKKNGVDDFGSVRNDNQWWNVVPGENRILYSRSSGNVAATSTLTVQWRHTWQ